MSFYPPVFYQPAVNVGQPKLSPLLKYPSNIPIENSNVKPIIIGIPIFFKPSTTLSEPASFPDDIASHPYFANINPAPINANIRSVLKTPCNCAINAHKPAVLLPAIDAALAKFAINNAAIKPPFRFGKIKG